MRLGDALKEAREGAEELREFGRVVLARVDTLVNETRKIRRSLDRLTDELRKERE